MPRAGLARLDADLLAFQDAFGGQPRELVGDGYEIAHDEESGVAIASRWPIAKSHELPFDSLVAEIEAPFGDLVFVNHCPSYQLDAERAREEQAVTVARLVEELSPEHAILAGDGEWLLEPGRRIDYILVRCSAHGPTLDIRACARLFDAPVDGVWASDHFGVTADLATHLPDGRRVP